MWRPRPWRAAMAIPSGAPSTVADIRWHSPSAARINTATSRMLRSIASRMQPFGTSSSTAASTVPNNSMPASPTKPLALGTSSRTLSAASASTATETATAPMPASSPVSSTTIAKCPLRAVRSRANCWVTKPPTGAASSVGESINTITITRSTLPTVSLHRRALTLLRRVAATATPSAAQETTIMVPPMSTVITIPCFRLPAAASKAIASSHCLPTSVRQVRPTT